MFKDFVYRFSMLLVILFIGFTSIQCEEEASSEALVYSDDHVRRSNTALEAWNISLATDTIATSRSATDNWIVIADDECNGVGILERTKDKCPFEDAGVLAFADLDLVDSISGRSILAFSDQELLDVQADLNNTGGKYNFIEVTAVVLKKSHVDDSSLTDDEIISTYVHEIGHALGLAHTGEWDGDPNAVGSADGNDGHIMYADANYARTSVYAPCPDELEAISRVYSATDSATTEPGNDVTTEDNCKGTVDNRKTSDYFLKATNLNAQSDVSLDLDASLIGFIDALYSNGLYHSVAKPVFKIYPYLP